MAGSDSYGISPLRQLFLLWGIGNTYADLREEMQRRIAAAMGVSLEQLGTPTAHVELATCGIHRALEAGPTVIALPPGRERA